MTRAAGFLALALLLLADPPGEASPADDAAGLQGTWVTVSLVNDGKVLVGPNVPAKAGPPTKLRYAGDKWLIEVGGETVASGTFKLDATRKPKEIDILDESGTRNAKAQLGIYELDGDSYTFCLAPAGKPRPTELSSPKGSGRSLGVSRREKTDHR